MQNLKTETKDKMEDNLKEVFVSYHFTNLENPIQNGFGNFVGKFHPEIYSGNMGKFVQHLEKSIIAALQDQLGIKCQVKVMFFR